MSRSVEECIRRGSADCIGDASEEGRGLWLEVKRNEIK